MLIFIKILPCNIPQNLLQWVFLWLKHLKLHFWNGMELCWCIFSSEKKKVAVFRLGEYKCTYNALVLRGGHFFFLLKWALTHQGILILLYKLFSYKGESKSNDFFFCTRVITNTGTCSNLLSVLLRCGTRAYEWSTQWVSLSRESLLDYLANHYATWDAQYGSMYHISKWSWSSKNHIPTSQYSHHFSR